MVDFEPEDLIAVIHSKYMVVRDALNALWQDLFASDLQHLSRLCRIASMRPQHLY